VLVRRFVLVLVVVLVLDSATRVIGVSDGWSKARFQNRTPRPRGLVPLSGHLFSNIEPRVETLGYDLLPLRGRLKLTVGRFPLTPAPSMT
jgi:hypothetical protein